MEQRGIFFKKSILAIAGGLVLILFDQFTKYMAVAHLKDQNPFVLIQNIFQLQYLENSGAAFGLLQGKKVLFLIVTFAFLIAAGFLFYKLPLGRKYEPLRIVIVVLASGAIGNMLDRVFRNYVVDFFYFEWIDFPIFNVADIYVTLSAATLFILLLFYYKEEDLNLIFPSEKTDRTGGNNEL